MFAVRRDSNDLCRVTASLPKGDRLSVRATAKKDRLVLQVASEEPVAAASSGLLLKHPSESLSVGFDERMPVDPEQPATAFSGRIRSVRVAAVDGG